MAQGLDHLRAAAQGLSRVRSGPIVLGAALIVAYALFWATYAWFSSSGGVHIDSLEAYAWGREFRLGYYKHPPFWAWVGSDWQFALTDDGGCPLSDSASLRLKN